MFLSFLLLVFPTLSLASLQQSLCSSVLLVQEQAEGYEKFHDPLGCAADATGCDVLNCRLCKRDSNDPNTTKCPIERISNRILTPEQQHAMDVVGISTQQMNLILDSVHGCVLEETYPTELSDPVLQGLDTYCQDHLSSGHHDNGISSFYSPHCIGQPGCIAALLMHFDGGCRYCRIPHAACINDCDPAWVECPSSGSPRPDAMSGEKNTTSLPTQVETKYGPVPMIVAITLGCTIGVAIIGFLIEKRRK